LLYRGYHTLEVSESMRINVKVILDAAMTLGFLALMEPKATGLSIHEWAGLGICVFFIAHKLLNKEWIVAATKGLFSKSQPKAVRLNYVVDLVLLLGFALIVVSGMAIAKTIDFTFLFPAGGGFAMKLLHGLAAALILAGVGMHLGLHWNWIKSRIAAPAARKA
jgi:hypothetical protein